ncbi:flippase-like domain-containing protein [bacterium]|nr:flippase-like domain-containing protein [bacterium]
MKTIFTSILKFIVAIGLIAWMVYSGMLELSSLAVLTNPLYLITSIFLVFLTIVINNIRWAFLLKMQDFKLSTKQTFPLTLIGVFFNYAIPGGVGGDVVKGYYLFKHSPTKKTLGTTTLFLDRLMGMYGMVLVSAIMLVVNYHTILGRSTLHALALSVIGVFCFISLFFILSFSASIKNLRFIDFLFNKIPGGSFVQKIYTSIHS